MNDKNKKLQARRGALLMRRAEVYLFDRLAGYVEEREQEPQAAARRLPSSETNFQLSGKCVVPEEWKAGIGHDFRHYKGKMYRLVGLAPHSETLEPMAVYQQLYGELSLWVRPAKMFFEEIEVDGRRIRRFERV